MNDSQKLLRASLNYHQSLRSHLDNLESDYQELQKYWEAFNKKANGDYIDQFRSGWKKTDEHFQYYINHSQKIYAFFEEKSRNLQNFNQEESFSLWRTLDQGIAVVQIATELLGGVVAGSIPDGRLYQIWKMKLQMNQLKSLLYKHSFVAVPNQFGIIGSSKSR